MIIKKTLITTTSTLFLSAILLSSAYTFTINKTYTRSVDYSGFINLADNYKSLTIKNNIERSKESKNEVATDDIIKVIEKEINQKNQKSKFAYYKPKKKIEKRSVVAAIEIKHEISTNEDLSKYEINNKELVHLKAISVEVVEYAMFEKVALSPTYDEEVKDEVATAQASTEVAPIEAVEAEVVSTQPVATEKAAGEKKTGPTFSENTNDEMVMFDYSDKSNNEDTQKALDKKLYDRPLSETVKKAIDREIGNSPAKKMDSVNTQESSVKKETLEDTELDKYVSDEDNIVYEYSKKDKPKKEENAFTANVSTQESSFILSAKEINLSTQKNIQASGFEFVPDYERSERVSDQMSGQITLNNSLSGEMNTLTGIVQGHGLIPTRVELNLNTVKGIEVPLLNEEGLQNLLRKKGISAEGNLLMIALDSTIADIELDSKVDHRLFFDSNFKLVSSNKGASFVLYVGVNSGNILIRYLLVNKETAQKIAYVGDGEMYFEDPSFIDSKRESYTLTTRNLLGQKKKELVIDGEMINYFNTKNIAKKKALNAYEVKIPTLTAGMRKYLEFKHLRDSVFVGSWSEHNIEIPSNEFISKMLELNQISSLKDRCIVQVNVSKDIRDFKVNGKNKSGEMFIETSSIDSDGNFSKDSVEMAEKIFVVGDMEGMLSLKLEYSDGSTEFVKTFCSQRAYLIEQL